MIGPGQKPRLPMASCLRQTPRQTGYCVLQLALPVWRDN
jgi:hypothetical protein